MKTLLRKTCTYVETHPVRFFLMLSVLVVPVAVCASYLYVVSWEASKIVSALSVTTSRQQIEADAIRENIKNEFSAVHKFSWILANDPRFSEALLNGDPGRLSQLNTYLKVFAAETGCHRVFMLDTAGRCVSANDYENEDSLLGKSFADRRYYQDAIAGKEGVEFVVGRVSTVPGFHFARPIMHGAEVIGVIVVKIDTFALARRIHFPRGFVTDTNGAIVLTDNPEYLLNAVNGTQSTLMFRDDIQKIYRQDRLRKLVLSPHVVHGFTVYNYGEDGAISLLHIVDMSDMGLLVYNFSPVNGYNNVVEQFVYRFFVTSLNASLVMLFVLFISIYMVRDYAQKKKLRFINAELEEMARYDVLTGCYNRRKFEEQLLSEFNRKRRTGHELSLAIIDIDNFKLVNDTFGHAGGDTVLKQFVQVVQSELRDIDFFARIGGEEFAIIFPFIDEDRACTAVIRLLEKIRSIPFTINGEETWQSFSAGVGSLMTSDPEEELELVKRVDVALYVAKNCGRSRVVRTSSISNLSEVDAADDVRSDMPL